MEKNNEIKSIKEGKEEVINISQIELKELDKKKEEKENSRDSPLGYDDNYVDSLPDFDESVISNEKTNKEIEMEKEEEKELEDIPYEIPNENPMPDENPVPNENQNPIAEPEEEEGDVIIIVKNASPSNNNKEVSYNQIPGEEDKDPKVLEIKQEIKQENKQEPKSEPKSERKAQVESPLNSESNLVNVVNINAPPLSLEENLGKMILDVDKGFLVNENEYDGLGNDDINDREIYQRLIDEVELQHPKMKNDDGTVTKYSVCGSDTGNMGCNLREAKSDFAPLGIGILFYFKIMKMFTILFFFLVIINIPLYYIYTTNHPEFKAQGYKDNLFKTTIGNIGSSLKNCLKIPIDNIFNQTEISFSLDCRKYNISSVIAFGLTSNYNYTIENSMYCQNFSTFVNITTDPNCSFDKYLNTFTSSNCVGKQSCKFTIPTSEIQTNCTATPKYDNFFFSYDCYDGWINGENVIDRTAFSFVVVVLDVASMICLVICLIVIPMAQQRTSKFFKENVIEISDYTIHFTNLGLKQEKVNEELNAFLNHLYYVSIIEKDEDAEEDKNKQKDMNIIYDINYPVLTDRKLDLILDKNNVTEKLNNLKIDLSKGIHNEKEKEKLQKELDVLGKKEKKLREQVNNSNNEEFTYVNDIYVTFTNQKIRNKIFKGYNRGLCSRCCLICCCQRNKIKHL